MSTYILLLTLTLEGRGKMLNDSESILRAADETALPGIQCLGLYGVLGEYDFVAILEAPDNDSVARFSLELGVKAGVHVTSLPAIPVARFEGASPFDIPEKPPDLSGAPPEQSQ